MSIFTSGEDMTCREFFDKWCSDFAGKPKKVMRLLLAAAYKAGWNDCNGYHARRGVQ